jgi:hypothetical protein
MPSRLQEWTRSRCCRASLELIGLGVTIAIERAPIPRAARFRRVDRKISSSRA